MDKQYLERNVHAPLSQALAALALVQPTDPVEFLGNWLMDYVHVQTKRTEPFLEEAVEEPSAEPSVPNSESEATLIEAELNEILQCKQHDAVYTACCQFLQRYTPATDVYIARRTQNELQYICATATSSMAGRTMSAPAEDEEDVTSKGISFDAWKPSVPSQANEEGEIMMEAPPYVLVDNVVRETRLKLFGPGPPRLGSYLAVPLNYNSCYHAQGLQMQMQTPTNEDGEPTGPAVAQWSKQTAPVSLLIGLDTVGNGIKFSFKDTRLVLQVVNTGISALESIEDELWSQQQQWRTGYDAAVDKLKDLYANAQQGETTSDQPETKEGDGGDSSGSYKQAYVRMQYWARVCGSVQQHLAKIPQHCLPPIVGVFRTLELIAKLLGVPEKDICGVCGVSSWEKLRKGFTDKLISKIQFYDPMAALTVSPSTTCEKLTELLNDLVVDKSSIADSYVPAAILLDWARAALTARATAINNAANATEPKPLEMLQH